MPPYEGVSSFYSSWDAGMRVYPGLKLYFIVYISLLNILAIPLVLWLLEKQVTIDIVRMELESLDDIPPPLNPVSGRQSTDLWKAYGQQVTAVAGVVVFVALFWFGMRHY